MTYANVPTFLPSSHKIKIVQILFTYMLPLTVIGKQFAKICRSSRSSVMVSPMAPIYNTAPVGSEVGCGAWCDPKNHDFSGAGAVRVAWKCGCGARVSIPCPVSLTIDIVLCVLTARLACSISSPLMFLRPRGWGAGFCACVFATAF